MTTKKSSQPSELELEEALFPRAIVPMAADTIKQYEFTIGYLAPTSYAAGLLDAHGRAVGSHDELAVMLRSPEALADLREAVTRFVYPADGRESIEQARRRAGDAAIAAFKRAAAEQIAAHAGHPLATAAKRYLAAVEARERASAEQRAQDEREAAERAAAAEAERERRRAEAERAAAELKRAQAEAETIEAKLAATRAEHRRLREQYFVAALRRLQEGGVSSIRLREGFGALFGKGKYSVADLIASTPGFSDEAMTRFERAVSDELERIEDAES